MCVFPFKFTVSLFLYIVGLLTLYLSTEILEKHHDCYFKLFTKLCSCQLPSVGEI